MTMLEKFLALKALKGGSGSGGSGGGSSDGGGDSAPVIHALEVTENGTYKAPSNVDGYNPITVDVPIPKVVLQNKTIDANGTYTADSGFDGLGEVTVNVATSGGEEWIGDGNTHIWITLHEGRTSPMLGVCPNGTVTVDWGDGTTPDTLTGTSTSTVAWTPNHNYAEPGDYVITLTVDGKIGFSGSSSTNLYSCLLRYSPDSDTRNNAYRNTVQKIEIGSCVTSIGDNAFSNCYSLASIVIPDSVTSIGNAVFQNCYSLASIVIPDSVTSIGNNTFKNCFGIRYIDFTKHTTVPVLSSTNAFGGIPADCEIRVPAALYDEWKSATNWATYASRIVAV